MSDATPLSPPDAPWQLICLCADWCGTCREWRPQLAQEAARHPTVRFSWVDIEDQADAMGDVDVETFPTLLIAQGPTVRFLGPVLPSIGSIGRLLESLREDPAAGAAPAADEPPAAPAVAVALPPWPPACATMTASGLAAAAASCPIER